MALNLENKNLYKHIDEILWNDWDPIGINDCEEARDEYTGYVFHMLRFKIQNANAEIIAQYLFKIETENMGLSGNIENCRKVADKIINL
jgi:hypothetical protein